MELKLSTLTHEFIPLANQAAWEQALKIVPHTYAHTYWYNFAIHGASGGKIFLYVGKSCGFQIIAPFVFRRPTPEDPIDITTPYGYSGFACIGENKEFPNEWKNFVQKNNIVCGYIGLHPLFMRDFFSHPADLFGSKKIYFLN